jgi:hypothetical protein
MTKLEELKATCDAARDTAYDNNHSEAWAVYGGAWNAYKAELNKNHVTKLDELEVAYDAAWRAEDDATWAVHVAWVARDASATTVAVAAWVPINAAYNAARAAYEDELKKVQEENSND